MWNYIADHVKAFWRGFAGGYVVWGGVLFFGQAHFPTLWIAYIVKLMGAGVLAFVSGLATVIAKYIFEEKIKHKLFKHKTDGKRNNKRAA